MLKHRIVGICLSAIICLAGLAGCAAQAPQQQAMPEVDPTLLTGQAIFGEPVVLSEAPAYDVLETTGAMRAYVGDIRDARLAVIRFRRLLAKLRNTGFFDNIYDASITQTAAATFDSRVGNCISYTNLFVALAREANLDVAYQIVEIEHPTWNVDTGLLIRNNHINVVVEGPRFDRNRTSGYTIDFNMVDPEPDARVTKVSDAYAQSLFYANLSVDEIMGGNDRLAFALLLRALDSEPRNTDLWINLGAFYSRHQRHREALQAYQIAQQLDPREKIVLSGMERSHRAMGDIELADQLARKVRRYRQQNPYFHFAVAQTAYDRQDYELSLSAIDRAIRLKGRNPRFFYMKSLAQHKLGDVEAAGKSLRKARRYGRFEDLERRYGGLEVSLKAG